MNRVKNNRYKTQNKVERGWNNSATIISAPQPKLTIIDELDQ